MIKFEYKPAQPNRTWGYAQDIPPVEELTMTLGDDVTWDEVTKELHNFLRAAGYVIPYDFEEEEEQERVRFYTQNSPQDEYESDTEREWVGLTEYDIQTIEGNTREDDFWATKKTWNKRFAEAIEDTLKRRNT